jgi:CDP-diacylglycerol--glycerol-3-phosphate 3-phosphatidyltransferase
MGRLTEVGRSAARRVFEPPARLLTGWGVSPDAVTVVGTVGVTVGALGFYPRGEFLVGTLVIVVFVFSDSLDGTMARLSGRSGPWGAFLDSTLDRVGDAAVFSGLTWWFLGDGDDPLLGGLALLGLVGGLMVSYARARGEGLGLAATGGVAERSERLVAVLLGTGLAGLGVPFVQAVALWLVAVGAWVTVGQRVLRARRSAAKAAPA